jgi:type II secretory pathway component PulF
VELLRKQIELAGKIRGALAYPGFLLCMTAAMTTGILVFLVPKFESLLMSRPDQLPTTTKWVLSASSFLRESPMFALVAAVLAGVGIVALIKSKKAQGVAFEMAAYVPA